MRVLSFRGSAIAAATAFAAFTGLATPSMAANVVVITGTATLPSFPCAGAGSLLAPDSACAGTFAGTTLLSEPGGVNIDGARISAYFEPCVPAAGSARGVLTDSTIAVPPAANHDRADFTWLRVGLVAFVSIHPTSHGDSFDLSVDTSTGGGVALAAFVPISTGNCVTGSAGLQATVVGAGVVF